MIAAVMFVFLFIIIISLSYSLGKLHGAKMMCSSIREEILKGRKGGE